MTETVQAHRLIYGIPTSASGTAWKVIASSVGKELTMDEQQRLVALTAVGELPENGFPGAIGFFGIFSDARGGRWAVLARYYRSLAPDSARRYFVQRDIFLVPWSAFARHADAAAFLDELPKGIQIERDDGRPLDRCRVDGDAFNDSRLDAVTPYSDDFVAQLLTAALTEPAAVLSPTPLNDFIPGLLLLLPSSIRRHVTYCTLVEDVSSQLCLKGIRAYKRGLSGAFAELDKGKFARAFEPLPIARALVESWRKGGTALGDQQVYLDGIFKDHKATLAEITDAHKVWAARRGFLENLNGENRWDYASAYVAAAADAESDRVEVAKQLIRVLELPHDASRFGRFLRDTLAPKRAEIEPIAEAMAETVRGGEIDRVIAAYKAFITAGYGEDFISALRRKLEPNARTIELFLAIHGVDTTANLDQERTTAIRTWAFAQSPGVETLSAFLALIRSAADAEALRANEKLASQVTSTITGTLARRLTELSVTKMNAKALFEEGVSLGHEAAAHGDDAVRAIRCAPRGWKGFPEVVLPFTTALLRKGGRNNAELAEDFATAYADVDEALLAKIEGLAEARKRAAGEPSAAKTLRIADARRAILGATRQLREAVSKAVGEWKQKNVTARELLSIVRSEAGAIETSPAAWEMIRVLLDSTDDRGIDFLGSASEVPDAQLFLTFAAMAMMGRHDSGGGDRSFPPTVAAASKMRGDRPSRPYVPENYKPRDVNEVSALHALANVLAGEEHAARIRQNAATRLSAADLATLAASSIAELRQRVEELDRRDGLLDRLRDSLEVGDSGIEASTVRAMLESLILRLEGETLGSNGLIDHLRDAQKAARRAEKRSPR